MAEERKEGRRKFLKGASTVAVTAPAVTILLSAASRRTSAQGIYDNGGGGPGCVGGDGGPGVPLNDGLVAPFGEGDCIPLP